MQTLFLDISNISNMKMTPKSADGGVFLQSKQGDVGRQFKAVIMDGEQEFPIPAGAQFSVWYSGPSGEGNYSSIGDRSAFSVDGNTVTVEMISQMLKKPGSGTLCLVLNTAQGKQLGLWNVIYAVEHVAGMDSEPAEDYYTALSELARQAINAAATFETDTSLTVAGKAADAAAVGAGLAGKAPAGYGLGDIASRASVAAGNASGFFATDDTPDTLWAWGTRTKFSDDYITEEVTSAAGLKARRIWNKGVAGQWESFNPPMKPGVEYRTTERWNGKVVYTKVLDCGTLPNNTYKAIATGTTITQCIRYDFVNISSSLVLTGHRNILVNVAEGNLQITTNTDLSAHHVFCAIWYTKD